MFYASVLPQFVNRGAGHVALQMLLLGGIFAIFAAGSLTMVTLSSRRVKAALAASPRVQAFSRWATGLVLIGFVCAWPSNGGNARPRRLPGSRPFKMTLAPVDKSDWSD